MAVNSRRVLMGSFTNQVVLITGAASGLGRQLALTLAAEGAAVAALDRSADGLEKLAADLPGQRYAWAVADVTDRTALRAAVARLEEQLGPIDVLIANAGIGCATPAHDFRGDDFEEIVAVNLVGVANSVEAVLAGMLARQRGHLVAISSLASYHGLPHMAAYCAAKAGVNALLDALRVELKPTGIAVTTICPGWIRTPMTANLDVPMPDILEVDDAARRIVAAIRRRVPLTAFPRSTAWRVRLLRWLPAGLGDALVRKMLPKPPSRWGC
jgi:NAD(P)-dependent dehydrogenase (short-subunit alcohol dehydrogenase family)